MRVLGEEAKRVPASVGGGVPYLLFCRTVLPSRSRTWLALKFDSDKLWYSLRFSSGEPEGLLASSPSAMLELTPESCINVRALRFSMPWPGASSTFELWMVRRSKRPLLSCGGVSSTRDGMEENETASRWERWEWPGRVRGWRRETRRRDVRRSALPQAHLAWPVLAPSPVHVAERVGAALHTMQG